MVRMVSHSSCAMLHPHQQCMRVPVLHILTNTFLFVWITAVPMGTRWSLTGAHVHFPDGQGFWASSVLTGSLCIFFGEMSGLTFAHCLTGLFSFVGVLSCRNSLCILDINFLSDRWFANISSNSVSCLSTLLMVSFDVQFLILAKLDLFFLLLPVHLVSYLRNHCLSQGHEDFQLCFILRAIQLLNLGLYSIFLVNFYIWHNIRVPLDSLAYGNPVFPAPFV